MNTNYPVEKNLCLCKKNSWLLDSFDFNLQWGILFHVSLARISVQPIRQNFRFWIGSKWFVQYAKSRFMLVSVKLPWNWLLSKRWSFLQDFQFLVQVTSVPSWSWNKMTGWGFEICNPGTCWGVKNYLPLFGWLFIKECLGTIRKRPSEKRVAQVADQIARISQPP